MSAFRSLRVFKMSVVLSLFFGLVAFGGATEKIENLPEVQKALMEGEEKGAAKFEYQFSTPEKKLSQRRFVVFLRTQLENGASLDSELVVIQVRRDQKKKLQAMLIFRDVSVLGLRESRQARLTESELQDLFLEYGRFELQRMGGIDRYREYASERIASGAVSQDEKWIFENILGKNWNKKSR